MCPKSRLLVGHCCADFERDSLLFTCCKYKQLVVHYQAIRLRSLPFDKIVEKVKRNKNRERESERKKRKTQILCKNLKTVLSSLTLWVADHLERIYLGD
jgi:hypothetical protein